MKASKGSRKIVINAIEYRWRATGNDGYIIITIWPIEHPGSTILGTMNYDERISKRDSYLGCWVSPKNQIVVTNKLIRRIVEYVCEHRGYSHLKRGPELSLGALEKLIDCSDAIRANEEESRRRDWLLNRSTESTPDS